MTDITPILLAFALGALAVALCGVFVVWTYFVPRSKYEALGVERDDLSTRLVEARSHELTALLDIVDLQKEIADLNREMAFHKHIAKNGAKVIHTLKDQVARLNGRRDAKGRWMKVTKL